MNYTYPLKPVHKLEHEDFDPLALNVFYLGHDEPTNYDVWLCYGFKLCFTTRYVVRTTVALDEPWNDQPQSVRRWVKRALDGGWLDDYFVLYRCEECNEVFVTPPNVPCEIMAIMKPPPCPKCESKKVSGQTPPKSRWTMAQYLIDEWGPAVATREGRWRIEEMSLHDDYAEVGYKLEKGRHGIVTGNWNSANKWGRDADSNKLVDDTPPLLSHLFVALGFELEWSDQWTTCEECYKLIRTVHDSYGWRPSHFNFGCGGTVCLDCLDEESVLEDLEGETGRTLNLARPIDPTEHGYVLLEDDFERGFHSGQDADPRVIAKSLKKLGIKRFLFMIDSVSQFDASFSLYIHEDEKDKVDDDKWAAAQTDGPSISEGIKHQLKNMPVSSGSGIQVSSVCPEGAVTVEVSPEDFAQGRSLDIARQALKEKLEREEDES